MGEGRKRCEGKEGVKRGCYNGEGLNISQGMAGAGGTHAVAQLQEG